MRRTLLIENDRTSVRSIRDALAMEVSELGEHGAGDRALANDGQSFELACARTGAEGLAQARTGTFEFILLAQKLPDRDGFEVLRQLRDSGIRVPILMLADRDDESDRVRSLRLGADDFVAKPVSATELLARMRHRSRAARRASVLDTAVHAARGAGDLDALVDKALGLTGVERGFVIVQRGNGELVVRAARGRVSDARFSRTIVQRVLASGRTEMALDAGNESPAGVEWKGESIESLRLRQAVCVPLRIGDRTIGVLYADSRVSGPGIDRCDQELLEVLAGQCASIIDHGRLRRAQREKRRMQAELQEVGNLQRAMLPNGSVRGARVEICGVSRPCDEAGGDYFDYIRLDDHRVALVIGDVVGHGYGSAILMAAARSLLRSFLDCSTERGKRDESGEFLGDVLGEVNRALVRDMPEGNFMSLFLGEVDLRTGALHYASAGHSPAIIHRANLGVCDELLPTGPALGLVPAATYDVCTVVPPIQQGDVLLLYTDGATEAADDERQLFGLPRLKSALGSVHEESAADIVRSLTQTVTEYAGGRLEDDLSYLVVKSIAARRAVAQTVCALPAARD